MTRTHLFNRIITAIALILLAVIIGNWLSKPPVTAAPTQVQTNRR
jgi:hypothetical protein